MSLTKTELDLILNGIDTVRLISQNTLNEVKGHEKRIGTLEAHCEDAERIFDEILDRTIKIKKISSDKISRPPRRRANLFGTQRLQR